MTTETALQPVEATEASPLALMTLQPEQYAAEVYQPFKTRLAAAIEAARSIDYDISTTKGMDVAKKARRTMMDIRIEANKQREERKAPIIKIGKLLESSYKAVEELVLPLETFFDGEIEAEEQRKKDKIASERARTEAIQERIGKFAKLVLQAAGKGSEAIAGLQEQVEEIEITEVDFEEFQPQAIEAKFEAENALMIAYKASYDAEQAIEAARIKREEEDRQRAAQAAENARVKAELEAQAAKQAAEAKRLADAAAAQQAEIDRQQREADAKIKAAADAEEARQKAAKAAHDAEMKRQADEMAAQRAAFEAQQQEAERAKALEEQKRQDAAKLEADHEEAIQIDAERDDWIKNRAAMVNSPAIADALIGESLDEINNLSEVIEAANIAPAYDPTDEEIIDMYIEAFGGTPEQALKRLKRVASALTA